VESALLYLIAKLGLGRASPTTLGLGKTMQVLSLLLPQAQAAGQRQPAFCPPASLLANWASEIERFAPV